jgi:hypothetical protein
MAAIRMSHHQSHPSDESVPSFGWYGDEVEFFPDDTDDLADVLRLFTAIEDYAMRQQIGLGDSDDAEYAW